MKQLYILTGASRGMGLAMARQLLAPQHRLLCISRQQDAGLQGEADARSCFLIQWSQDLSDTTVAAARLEQWLDQQDARTLSGATLINNAGVIPAIGPIELCPPEQLSTALRVGLEAPMQLTAAFLRASGRWVGSGWSGPRKVLNISSGLGRYPMAAQAPYCAAKAGLDHFTRCTALDEQQHPRGARLVSLAPGVIDTDMQVQLRSGDPALFPDRQRFLDLQSQGALSSPEAAAARVLAWLDRPEFGANPVADVRDSA
ncbi:MAG TPA: SDR family NAD(P)-dependent oxidoreductase [Hydrogenophaga sp.]|uniref:SDR family NAD(P)-dependent oxidoreductase n=1 Tax=Hydrogenophaga sp. TaxID=1904254 RepID=UPI002CD5A881|nr:SDR family NAD(P)-dependent oxidoreductase [Hydrogenophaga sp.]HMN93791.1 SDR family NAD(P)-dependent oxidoreductase [Hydrogenophaga sp.]HMP09686.1 SDR family NAD(P)-dependent oxidoreductase [Hydrogenophaga sp.]